MRGGVSPVNATPPRNESPFAKKSQEQLRVNSKNRVPGCQGDCAILGKLGDCDFRCLSSGKSVEVMVVQELLVCQHSTSLRQAHRRPVPQLERAVNGANEVTLYPPPEGGRFLRAGDELRTGSPRLIPVLPPEMCCRPVSSFFVSWS